jgi:hypothetical protein
VWLCSGGHSWFLNMKVWKCTQISKTIRIMEKGCGRKVAKIRKRYPCNRLWRRMEFWGTRIPHFLGNWLTGGSEAVSLIHQPPLTPGRFLVLISVRDWVDSRAIVRLERLGQMKNTMTTLGTEPTTFQLVA